MKSIIKIICLLFLQVVGGALAHKQETHRFLRVAVLVSFSLLVSLVSFIPVLVSSKNSEHVI